MTQRSSSVANDRAPRCAFFGPTPPPYSGMEVYTRTALDLVADLPPFSQVNHVDTRVNTSRETRGTFQFRKLGLLAKQFAHAATLALRRSVAYYPISQNRIGIARDLVLLAPFRVLRRPIVLHLHGSALGHEVLPTLPGWMRRALHWICAPHTTSGICLTDGLRDAFGELLAPERVRVMENVVPRAALPTVPLDPERSQLRLLFIGSLIPGKGYRELLEAVARCRSAGLAVRLTLAGSPGSPEDERWVREREDGDAVSWVGLVSGDDKWRLIDDHDLLVVPSTTHPEGQPIVILESFARGRPVLATDRGGIRDTVSDSAGIVVDCGPSPPLVDTLVTAIEPLTSDRESLLKMSASAFDTYEARFSPDGFRRQWTAVLGRALDGARPSR